MQKYRQGFVALLQVEQRPVNLKSGSECFRGLQEVGIKAPQWKKPCRSLGKISFGQIAADAECIMPGVAVTPGLAPQKMNGRIYFLTEEEIEKANAIPYLF